MVGLYKRHAKKNSHAMSIIANAITGFIADLLLKPIGYRDCPEHYDFGTTPQTVGVCYPVLESLPQLATPYKKKLLQVVNSGAGPQDIIWERYHKDADHSGVANSANCPPNTYPFNGSCLSHCPQGYVERAYPDNDPAKISQGIEDMLYECVAECSQSWHPMTWDSPRTLFSEYDDNERNIIWTSGAIVFLSGGIDKYKQLEQKGSLFCYHVASKDSDGLTLGYSRTPFNIQPYEVSGTGVEGGLGRNKFHALHVGLYGERGRLALGAPKMAGACPPPNVAGDDGVCYRPTPPGMKLIGNRWFTTFQCPTEYSIPSDDGKQCMVKGIDRGKWPSLLQLIIYIVAIGLVVFIAIKIIQAFRK